MKQCHPWLLASLSILVILGMTSLATAEGTVTSGSVEIGVSSVDTKDNPARVNEYVNGRSEEGLSFAPKVSIETQDDNSAFEFDADIQGPRDQQYNLEFDGNRIIRFKSEYSALEHWKDHDNLEHIGATMVGDLRAGQPTIFSDATVPSGYDAPEAIHDTRLYDPTADAQTAYDQEIDNDYITTRREFKNEADITLPGLPNITFHAGIRIEDREGLEQSIGLSKCDACHVNAKGKEINERTRDLSFGVTGRFGLATIEYEYLNRSFEEDGATPTRYYDAATTTNSGNYLLYGAGTTAASELEYNKTPDSEKDSHQIKVRIDFTRDTNISASYVKADVESTKTPDASFSLENDTLSTELESFGAKLATRINSVLKLSLRGSTYEIDATNNAITYPERNDVLTDPATFVLPFDSATDDWLSAEERKISELGVDAVYRLAKGTTLRLGYGYENIKREEKELGETTTHTVKAALKSRLSKKLSARLSYEYQNIDDPFGADEATGIYQLDGTYVDGSDLVYEILQAAVTTGDLAYWNAVYPERDLAATNQPDSVHEAKLNTTWSPSANLAATFFARLRYEENDEVGYEQTSLVPGANIWYAPTDKLNLTMSYTFSKRDTQNRACVGWYHG